MDPYQNNQHYYNNNSQGTNYNYQTIISQSHLQENTSNISHNYNNKSIYINQNFKGLQNLPLTSKKVLINPNFLIPSKVHINPSYVKIKGIFINPHIIATQTKVVQTQAIENSPKNAPDVIISTKNKWIRKSTQIVKNMTMNNNSALNVPSTSKNIKTPLKYTKYKIIRKETTPKRKRRTSLNLRYKLVRSSQKTKLPEKQAVKNKFKLDRRFSNEKIKSKLYLLNKAYRLKIDHRNGILKRNSLSNNKTLEKSTNPKKASARMSRILNISGVKYKMDTNKMVLKLAMTATDMSTSKRTVKMRRIDQINKIPLRTKLRTNNIPCPTYHRFGICQRHNRGMCQKVHNPDQITLCSKFLQGLCHNDKCLLSHKISASKMPTCKFYLEGLCSKDGCPYLHVKINSKVTICKQFLSGFCQLGKECDKRHEFLCPDFELNGNCAKKKCQFPHRTVKRKSTDKVKVLRNQVKYKKMSINKEKCKISKIDSISSDKVDSSNKRYYQGLDKPVSSSNAISDKSESNISSVASNSPDDVNECNLLNCNEDARVENSSNDIAQGICIYSKRPQLGTLPVFIPF